MKASERIRVAVGLAAIWFGVMAYGLFAGEGTPSDAPHHRGNPSGTLSNDKLMFADVTNAIAKDGTAGQVIVQAIRKNPDVVALTGEFSLSANAGVSPVNATLKPNEGMMLVKVILDFYTDKAGVLWKDDIAVLDGGAETAILQLVGDHGSVVEVGFTGLRNIRQGGNRIALVVAAKEGDPSQLKLRLHGKDCGTLGSLRSPEAR